MKRKADRAPHMTAGILHGQPSENPYKTNLEAMYAMLHELPDFSFSPAGSSSERGHFQGTKGSGVTFDRQQCHFPQETPTAENVDRFCKRSKLLKNNSKKRLPFRKYYASNKDQTIADIMYYYFSAVRNTFVYNGVSLWDLHSEKNILQTTIGYSILMDILAEILDRPYNDEQISISFFEQYLIKAKSIQFFDYAIHTASRKQLINDLKEAIFG